jgi:hypothetical protein
LQENTVMHRVLRRSRLSVAHCRHAVSKKRLRVEELESRNLPSVFLPALAAHPELGPPNVVLTQGAYGPSQVRHAYGFDQITFAGKGNHTVAGTGAGQTIAIVDAFDDPNIAADLAVFDQNFNLPAPPSFAKLDQYGGTNYPAVDSGWDLEISLDVEWAHAIAPQANIVLVESASNQFSDMLTAVDFARRMAGVSVVSMSWGAWEAEVGASFNLAALDAILTTPTGHAGITFVASTGDNGAAEAPEWPAASPNALAVGGTTLTTSDTQGTYGSETAWTLGGGGIATFESEPSWQAAVQSTGKRTNPDVSIVGDPQTGVAVYDSVPMASTTGGTTVGWYQVGGTSAGSPMWSALLAIANQGRALQGKGPLNRAQVIVYSLSTTDFHDVTTGTNGYPADTGYDLATGIGTPLANVVVRDFVQDNHVVDLPPGILPILPFSTLAPVPLAVPGSNDFASITVTLPAVAGTRLLSPTYVIGAGEVDHQAASVLPLRQGTPTVVPSLVRSPVEEDLLTPAAPGTPTPTETQQQSTPADDGAALDNDSPALEGQVVDTNSAATIDSQAEEALATFSNPAVSSVDVVALALIGSGVTLRACQDSLPRKRRGGFE